MLFKLRFSEKSALKLQELELDKSKKGLVKQLKKILGFMEVKPLIILDE